MYIRRKVFSIGYDAQGEERLFSTNEILNEDAYLRMFAEEEEKKEEKKGLTKAQKRALLAAGGVAATAAGIYGAKKLGQRLEKNANTADVPYELKKKNLKKLKVAKALQKPADLIAEGSKKSYDAVAGVAKKGYGTVAGVAKKGYEKTKEAGSKLVKKVRRNKKA